MGQPQVRFLVITLIAAATAACGASAPSVAPTPNGDAVATITLGNFGQADGPGISVGDAIAKSGAEPLLVNGILLKEADGMIWLCTALMTSATPRCAEPRLLVENRQQPPDDVTFVSSEGLHESAGVRWLEHMQLFGVVRP